MRQYGFLAVGFSLLIFQIGFAQKSQPTSLEVWRLLRSLKYETKTTGLYQPLFTPAIQNLDGKKVTLEGFMIVIQHERKPKNFMLSYFPVNACFFCGAAGPESVIEVESTQAITYTDDPVSLTGYLRLNAKDENRMFYILEKAVPQE
jgi:hypothetical protein